MPRALISSHGRKHDPVGQQHPSALVRVGDGDLHALLSDHLHCERKAAENALSLVRRYPHRGDSVDSLSRLAHEETSHIIQVAGLLARRGWAPRGDTPNLMRGRCSRSFADGSRTASWIRCWWRPSSRRGRTNACPAGGGFLATGEAELGAFYRALSVAEERHGEIFLELAVVLVPGAEFSARVEQFGQREAEILRRSHTRRASTEAPVCRRHRRARDLSRRYRCRVLRRSIGNETTSSWFASYVRRVRERETRGGAEVGLG